MGERRGAICAPRHEQIDEQFAHAVAGAPDS